jgi:SAM-dependent methyltransferase
VPREYYRRIRAAEDDHWWFCGMREVGRALLRRHLPLRGRVLDAGCGTGAYLRWLLDLGTFSSAVGVDIASAAIELAAERVPEAELHVAPLAALPFEDASFSLAVTNDVLQHVEEDDVARSVGELHRVLEPGGLLLLRTNGARRLRRERSDWRAYDAATLCHELEQGGFDVLRLTYANCLPSLWGRLRGRVPHAPTADRDGIPTLAEPRLRAILGRAILRAEAQLLSSPRISLPYGHTLFALARRR